MWASPVRHERRSLSFAYFSGVNDAAFSVTETAGPWDGPAYWLNALVRSLTRPIKRRIGIASIRGLGSIRSISLSSISYGSGRSTDSISEHLGCEGTASAAVV